MVTNMRHVGYLALLLLAAACADYRKAPGSVVAVEPGKTTYQFRGDHSVDQLRLIVDGRLKDREYLDRDAREITLTVVETPDDLTFFVRSDEGDDFGMFYAKPFGAASTGIDVPQRRDVTIGTGLTIYRQTFRTGHDRSQRVEVILEPPQ